jgi:CopG family nickel-responsive transcriptional regulator
MSKLVRLSLSLEAPLCDELERLVQTSGCRNRSEFVRNLIREQLVAEEWEKAEEIMGTITLVYNHHQRELSEKLTALQHDCSDCIMAATHVHLSHEICAEMIMTRGRPADIRKLADAMRQQRGVLHVALSMSSTGKSLH